MQYNQLTEAQQQQVQQLYDDNPNVMGNLDKIRVQVGTNGIVQSVIVPSVTGKEVADLLAKAAAGEVPVYLAEPGETLEKTYCGNIDFVIEGHTITFFIDCDEIDYVDYVTWADGRTGDFDEWWNAQEEPVDLLMKSNLLDLLDRVLRAASTTPPQ